jgi:uncharacterized FlgJ-related protein
MRLLKNFKNRLKGSSIVETIIAIVLISICSLVALSVYLNVISQTHPIHYYEAKHKIEQLTHSIVVTQNFENDIYRYPYYTIEQQVFVDLKEPYAIVDFRVTTANKTYTIKKLVKIDKTN